MNETIKSIKDLLVRDLDRLTNEIESYHDEHNIWELSGSISNTAGNLCLHICGNLKHFIGTNIGNTGYIRKRDDEFGLKDVSRSDLLENIAETKEAVISSLDNMDANLLDKPYPQEVFGEPMSHAFFMIHLAGHLNYHLGQINYQRRLMD